MAYDEYRLKLDSILFFITNGSAVNLDTLAIKLCVSKSTAYRMVSTLKTQGVPIKYCERRKVYFLEKAN